MGGGGYYNHGMKNLFPDRFLAVSLHISILLYIRTFHSRGEVFSFKAHDLGAFQKSNPTFLAVRYNHKTVKTYLTEIYCNALNNIVYSICSISSLPISTVNSGAHLASVLEV